MDKFWEKAITVTGPVAVVGFLLAVFINKIFEEKVLEYFGSENSFYLIVGILCLLGAALIISILVYKDQHLKPNLESKPNMESKSATITNSKIDGDIVFGDKTINQDRKRDK